MIAKPETAASHILRAAHFHPTVAIQLGSGFQAAVNIDPPTLELPYEELPGFPKPKVQGHPGKLIIGTVAQTPVMLLCGRNHYYEGFSLSEITFPIRVLGACGIQVLLLTNAAGGINWRYRPGDFMALRDHLNFMGDNPLRGCHLEGGLSAFVDLSEVYDPDLIKVFGRAAEDTRVRFHTGVYAAVAGPSYETPAEVRALRRLGADAVGMSTVPEAIVARQLGLRVAALSCITNRAAGLSDRAISHAEVLEVGRRVKTQTAALLAAFLRFVAV